MAQLLGSCLEEEAKVAQNEYRHQFERNDNKMDVDNREDLIETLLKEISNENRNSFFSWSILQKEQKEDYYINTTKQLQTLRNKLIAKYKDYKFPICDTKCKMKSTGKAMFDCVSIMESMINIKNTDLEMELMEMEQKLINNTSKEHISRRCSHPTGCFTMAPKEYPRNIYICDKHKEVLYNKLQCDIPCHNGSDKEKQKCLDLKKHYQLFMESIRTPDKNYNKEHLYPNNYFAVTIAKLLYLHQQVSKVDITSFDNTQKKTIQKFQQILETLMDLLIAGRQNLNDFWSVFFTFIISLITAMAIKPTNVGTAWVSITEFITSSPWYIFALNVCVVALASAIIYFLIFGDKDMKFITGCIGLGAGIGMYGGPAASLAGGLIGGGIGAIYKYH